MQLVQRIIPESSTHQLRDAKIPATLVLHSNGASRSVASLYEYILNSKTRIYPHVQVAFDGSIEQYCPWDRQAYVQYDGNRYAYSAETQDSGYNNKPIDRDPWTDAQLHAFAELALSLGVEAKACTSPTSGGIGYHSQFRAEWNKSGHNCPGSGRRDQIPQVLAYMTQVVIAQPPTPPPTPQESDDVPYLLISLAGFQNIVGCYPGGPIRQMPLSEYLFLRDVAKVPSVTETTSEGIDQILLIAHMDHSELVKV